MRFINSCEETFKTNLRTEPGQGAGDRMCQLIWGDPVHPTPEPETGGFTQVFARGRSNPGWVQTSHISETGLLEFYIIDVGQGDGVLIRTPDNHWHLIDAGKPNEQQMLGKGAANFIRWKFNRDLKQPAVLENLILSHPDFDHYGGMLNLLSGDLGDGKTPFEVTVKNFYHCGMGRFDKQAGLGDMLKGEIAEFPIGGKGLHRKDSFISELLDNKASFDNTSGPFAGAFAELANLVVNQTEHASRIGSSDGQETWLQNYAPDNQIIGPNNTPLTIKVLGPIIENFQDENGRTHAGLRKLASESITRNGHSVVLRFDYGAARIMMTGDLNDESQRLLLSYLDAQEFACDVAKGCHHGSEDIHLGFIEALKARATVISSGDNESFSHPRPVILGASAFYGRQIVTAGNKKEILPPLIYSTELARSTNLAQVTRVRVDHDEDPHTKMRSFPFDRAQVQPKNKKYRAFSTTPVATDLVYGLVNVRTDGTRILCATLEESGTEFDIKVFQAGVAPE